MCWLFRKLMLSKMNRPHKKDKNLFPTLGLTLGPWFSTNGYCSCPKEQVVRIMEVKLHHFPWLCDFGAWMCFLTEIQSVSVQVGTIQENYKPYFTVLLKLLFLRKLLNVICLCIRLRTKYHQFNLFDTNFVRWLYVGT